MRSSTSSSESRFVRDRLPAQAAPSVWRPALLLAACLLSAAETGWRSVGHRPSVIDNLTLWSYHRGRAAQSDPRTLVLCGASRTLLGFATDTFRERYPEWKLVQLAVDGRAPLATLADLASDPQFRGVVALEIHESAVGYSVGQQEQVDFYHSRSGLTDVFECLCCAAIQERLVVVLPALNPKRLLTNLMDGDDWPLPGYRRGHFDRRIDADYQRLDIAAHREWRMQRIRTSYSRWGAPSPQEWQAKAGPLVQAAKAIEARGGKVVFIRYPTSGEYWELDRKYYPRKPYWDDWVQAAELTAIHFQDLPQTRQLECPDTSHLDYRDAPVFTNELLSEMEKLDIFKSAKHMTRAATPQ